MLNVAAIHTANLPIQLFHHLQQTALAHMSVGLFEADSTQILCGYPLLPIKDRLTFEHRALPKEVRTRLIVTTWKITFCRSITVKGTGLWNQFWSESLIFRRADLLTSLGHIRGCVVNPVKFPFPVMLKISPIPLVPVEIPLTMIRIRFCLCCCCDSTAARVFCRSASLRTPGRRSLQNCSMALNSFG